VGLITIYRWCKEERLPCIKLGKHWRIRREALKDLLEQRERPATLSRALHSFLSTLPAHIAIIDSTGTIVAVNEAWRDFATSNGATVSKVMEGTDYLRVCDSAMGEPVRIRYRFRGGDPLGIFW
jgi:excisionase family DNA binding protein